MLWNEYMPSQIALPVYSCTHYNCAATVQPWYSSLWLARITGPDGFCIEWVMPTSQAALRWAESQLGAITFCEPQAA